jgi:hypothetical protein
MIFTQQSDMKVFFTEVYRKESEGFSYQEREAVAGGFIDIFSYRSIFPVKPTLQIYQLPINQLLITKTLGSSPSLQKIEYESLMRVILLLQRPHMGNNPKIHSS